MNPALQRILLESTPVIPHAIKRYTRLFLDVGFLPGPGVLWPDISGNGNNCTMYNLAGATGSLLVPGLLSLDGVDDYGAIINSASVDITEPPLAVFATVRVATGASSGYVLGKNLDTPGNIQYALYWSNTGTLFAGLEGVFNKANSAMGVFPVNTFLDGGFFWNGTNVQCYINGTASGVAVALVGTLTSQANFRVGRIAGAGFFKGDLKNVSIYAGSGLTVEAVLAHRRQIMRRHGVAA